MALRVEQELDGARVAVADLAREPHGVGAHPVAQLGRQVRRRRDLDHLLVPPLDRAVTLEEVDHVALGVGEDLHLDVPRLRDRLLDEHGRVAEGALALAHADLDRLAQVGRVVHPAHAAAATAGDRLHEQRVAELLRGLDQGVDVVVRLHRAQGRDTGGLGRGDRTRLVAGQLQHLGGGPDERDPGGRAGLRQLRVLREEAVARVDRVGADPHRRTHDQVGVEVGPHRVPALADLVGLVGLEPVLRAAVLVGEDGDGRGAHLRGGTERAHRDLAPVGHQYLREHAANASASGHRGRPASSRRNRRVTRRPLHPCGCLSR